MWHSEHTATSVKSDAAASWDGLGDSVRGLGRAGVCVREQSQTSSHTRGRDDKVHMSPSQTLVTRSPRQPGSRFVSALNPAGRPGPDLRGGSPLGQRKLELALYFSKHFRKCVPSRRAAFVPVTGSRTPPRVAAAAVTAACPTLGGTDRLAGNTRGPGDARTRNEGRS